MMNSIPGFQGLDDFGLGINFDDDSIDDDCNDNNVNKPSLKDYPLSQYITTQPSVASLTQLSETSLSNVKTNLDFDAIPAMSQKIKRTLNDNFPTNKRLKKSTLSEVDSKAFSIPHGAHCGPHQISKIDLKLSSQPLSSSSSDSSSSESSSERQFDDIEVKNEFSLTPGCGNCDLDCKLPNLLKDSDESNSGLTQILKEYPEAENEIDSIVNVVEFKKSLSPFFFEV